VTGRVPDVVAFALVVALVVGAVAFPVSALGPAETTDEPGDDRMAQRTASNGAANGSEPLAPGQRLAGVVGVQAAEIDGELAERTLATRVSRAASTESKAAVLATELDTVRSRLQRLRETQTELRTARRSGDISTGEYRARMAVTAARIQAVRTRLDSSEAASRDLPAAALEGRGVTREELDRLREDADGLRGPEVAEIAREVAGDDGGRELDPERGPDDLPEPARADEEDEEEEEDDPGNSEDTPGRSGDVGDGDDDTASSDDDAPENAGDPDDDTGSPGGGPGNAGNRGGGDG
jgi:hypothetical protein